MVILSTQCEKVSSTFDFSKDRGNVNKNADVQRLHLDAARDVSQTSILLASTTKSYLSYSSCRCIRYPRISYPCKSCNLR